MKMDGRKMTFTSCYCTLFEFDQRQKQNKEKPSPPYPRTHACVHAWTDSHVPTTCLPSTPGLAKSYSSSLINHDNHHYYPNKINSPVYSLLDSPCILFQSI